MFIPKNGHKLEKGMLVGLHYNSRNKMFSVVKMKSKKSEEYVLGYVTKCSISNAYQLIKKSEQNKVRKEKVKNRHAFLCGTFEGYDIEENIDGQVYYNPQKVDQFVDSLNNFKVIENVQSIQFDLTEENGKVKPIVTYIA